MDTVIFTITKNGNGTYKVFCKNGFNTYNKYDAKDLYNTMVELADVFNNVIKMAILFEIED